MMTLGMTLGNAYYLMRHGESEANAAGIIVSDPAAGLENYGLTAKGREEAGESALAFLEGHAVDLVYSSDFRRALDTAMIAAEIFGVREVRASGLLRERWFGELDGGDDARYGMVWERDLRDPDHHSFGVESPRDVGERVLEFLSRCEEEHAGKDILVVAHGDVLQILFCVANGIPVRRHRSIEPMGKAEIRPLSGSTHKRKEDFI